MLGFNVVPCETDVGDVVAVEPAVGALSTLNLLLADEVVFFGSLEVAVSKCSWGVTEFGSSAFCCLFDLFGVGLLPLTHLLEASSFGLWAHALPARLVLVVFSDGHYRCFLFS